MKVGGGSFLSSHDPRMVLGIGKRAKIAIGWKSNGRSPALRSSVLLTLPLNRYITIVEGMGKWQ